jgi:hypothetical protein
VNEKDPIKMECTVVQVADLLSTTLEGNTVLMSLEQGKYYGMDSVGSRIWELISQPRAVTEVCDRLMDEYDVAGDRWVQDVLIFLNDLQNENLLKVV